MASTKNETIVLGGGCFWCLDASYRLIKGIAVVTSGYSGGKITNPSYNQVSMGNTGHAEVIKIEYDPIIISLNDILDIFWAIHDPTTMNRQGNDTGAEYRSIIFYDGDAQKQIIDESKEKANKVWDNKIVTEIVPLEKFYPAEESHQNFFEKNPDQAYCQVIINPKLKKLREKFTSFLTT